MLHACFLTVFDCFFLQFTGSYNLEFTVECNDNATGYADAEALCTNYTYTHPDPILLGADLEWLDEVCDPEMFLVRFDAEMSFWRDDTFAEQLGAGDQYKLYDTAYVEVLVGDPALIAVVNLTLDNVWLCTTSPDNEPLSVTQQSMGTGGCLSAGLDPGFPKHIVVNGAPMSDAVKGNVTVYYPFAQKQNRARFSFPVEASLERVKLFVHAQIMLDLTPTERRRRRALLQSDVGTASQITHFGGSVAIANEPFGEVADLEQGEEEDGAEELPLYVLIVIPAVATSLVCLCGFLVFVGCFRKRNARAAKREMDSVPVY